MPDDIRISVDDPPPSAEERARYAALTQPQRLLIDRLLLRHCSESWKKMARIVAGAMLAIPSDLAGITDACFAERLRHFVAEGQLEARGNVSAMQYCELRLPRSSGRET